MLVNTCLWVFEGVAVATELIPEDGTFRAGRSPPGGLIPNGRHGKLQPTHLHDKALLSIGRLQASFNGSSRLQVCAKQASTGPASFKGPSELQRVQQDQSRTQTIQKVQKYFVGDPVIISVAWTEVCFVLVCDGEAANVVISAAATGLSLHGFSGGVCGASVQ